ncbi:MAG TPA: copper chaperone PCu(A)C [Alphaproteobacteria bacterium]|nr:copper chaperone PCu(A)C [Alphaproteobacteria bacterium]
MAGFAAPVSAQPGTIAVENAWAPPTPGASKTAAVYFTVINRGGTPARIVGAATPAAEHADMHTTIRDGDIMRMRRVVSVEIPAGGKAVFAPNGFHVMLTGLKAPLKMGDKLQVTLKFAEAGDVPVVVTVRR